ncbi:Spy/CpxP family protein refolding chaperone [Methylocapsa polymorpha]|uniref:Spy/CpxP family protein refolding chaperone n=1 Tax=Methylocapsa polymorpha TaxID=3080828 RepID=A0ABZ0HSU4_9HYPH|nr:Spy/CpxP family protein refolding chaperone [Methylocapsa sp. RX1]
MRSAAILVIGAVLVLGSAPALARNRGERQDRTPQTANQILDEEVAQIAQIRAKLLLAPDQEKNWSDLETALRDIAKKRADRMVVMRTEMAQQKGPVDLIEQWRGIADILNERSIDLKTLADAAQPLYSTLSDEQKKHFKEEIERLEKTTSAPGLK